MPLDTLFTQVRRGLYASLGAISLADEELDDLLSKLAARGEDIARARFGRAEALVREGARDGEIFQQTLGEEVLRQRRQLTEALNLPTHETVRYLTEQVEHLSAEIEALAARRAGGPNTNREDAGRRTEHSAGNGAKAAPVPPPAAETVRLITPPPSAPAVDPEPWPGYATLNVGSVTKRLASLAEVELLAVRAYEERHGRRVTILRAVTEALAGR